MKKIALSFLLFASISFAGTGSFIELKFPQGSSTIATTNQSVAMNDSHILVGFPLADVKLATGKTVSAAGEVQVFNAVTGSFIRRIVSQQPSNGGKFGARVVMSGDKAIIEDINTRVSAFEPATGKHLWSYRPLDDNGSLTLNNGLVEFLAADGDSIRLGMPKAWWVNDPAFNFYIGQGFVGQVQSNGTKLSLLLNSPGEENAAFGSSVAVSGNLSVAGEPLRDQGGQSNSGSATVFQGSDKIADLLPPASVANDEFGSSVAIARDRILVGAAKADVSGKSNVGCIYVYSKSTFDLTNVINPPANLGAFAMFGSFMTNHGSMVAIGASGSAWTYDVASGVLAELPKPATATTGFGGSLAICRHSALVADNTATGGTATMGRVYLYQGISRTFPVSAVIASTTKQAPGCANGTVFSAFGNTAASPTGKVITLATITSGGASAANNAGAWSNQGMSLDLLLRKGDTMASTKFSAPTLPFFANDSTGRFLARNATTLKQSVFKDNGSSVVPIMTEGSKMTINGKVEIIGKIFDIAGSTEASSSITVAASSLIVPGAVSATNDTHISRHIGPSLVNEAREGYQSAIAGTDLGQIAPRIAVESGRLAYVAALAGAPTSSNSALFVKSLGINNTWAMARKGDPAPGAGSAKFGSFLSTAINGSFTLFRASLTGGTTGVTSGLWQTTLINNNTQVAIYPVAIRLQPAGGTPSGVKFSKFMDMFIASGNAIVFRAQLTGPGVTAANDMGVWLHSKGTNYLLIREGSHVAGVNGPKVGTIQRVDMSKSSHYAVLVSLTGTSASANQGLLTGNFLSSYPAQWMPSLVLQKGQLIERPTPVPVTSISMAANHIDASGSGTKGQASQVCAGGVVFTAGFAGGKDLLLYNP